MEYPIIVDSRETRSRKKRAEKLWGEENIIIKQMPVGDYVYMNVGIEFKTVDDFIGSVKTKRVYNQAIALDESFKHSYIIIYGDVTHTLNRLYRIGHSFSVKQYLGAVASLSQIVDGVLSVDNETQAFQLTKSLFEKCTDGKNRKVKSPTYKSRNKIIGVLSYIGGINNQRAEDLVTALDIRTLHDLLLLTKEDITSVRGFGDKTAENIIRWLR